MHKKWNGSKFLFVIAISGKRWKGEWKWMNIGIHAKIHSMKKRWSRWMEWAESWPNHHRMPAISIHGTLSFWGHSLRSNDGAVVSKQSENAVVRKEKKKWTRIFSMKYNCHARFFFLSPFTIPFHLAAYSFFFLRQDRISLHRKGHSHTSTLGQVYSLFWGLLCISLDFMMSCERTKISDYSWL